MRRNRGGLYIFLAVVAVVAAIAYFIYTSEKFEREKPTITAPDLIYWNLKKPLTITINDNVAVKSYSVTIANRQQRVTLDKQELTNPQKTITLTIKPPANMQLGQKALLEIEAKDRSFWNYFTGNSAKKTIKLKIDTKKPQLNLITNSYAIVKGGSALVVFECRDENLQDFYIETNFGKKFYAQPFYKDGFYAALIAWPITEPNFRANIVAFDKAKNRSKVHIPLYLRSKSYKVSKIHLKESFLKGKISILAEDYPETASMSLEEKFRFINEKLREANEKLIHAYASKVPKQKIDFFSIKPFYPLKNAAAVASFGTHRYYYYKGKLISESYHLGLDLASVKRAPVKASNPGDVVYADYNGIYGNMPLISHGLGLYTLYGHCSTLLVKSGDRVREKQIIAKTGNTGLALGDHLHFGVLVQGIEVRPSEWMDKRWIKLNITQILQEAKKIIDTQ